MLSGALSIADDDAGEASFSAGTVTGSYGSLTIDASGAWTYEADNTQTLDGVNDVPAVITGTDSGSVSEDDQAATLSVTGALSIADDDAGEASFSAGTVTGSYGSLTIDASGAWTYEADNTQTAIQQLGTGDSLTDTLQVTAQDGSTQDIVITLDGVDDAAVITGTDSGSVSEDDQAATLSVTGALSIADDDAGEASFSAGTVTGSYGSLTIDASGAWTYEADNTQTAIQQLGTGDSLTDTLQVTAQDGTTQDIVITLDGTNDAAVITGTDSGSVSEDDQAATLSVTGALSIADDDAGEASFSAGTVTGSYGSLTIDASGAWTYEADNTQTTIQQLGTGDSLTDTLQVTAQDGSTQDIVITLDGVNDAAVITGTDSGSVSEDDQAATLSVTGALSIADDDAGEASFSAGTVTGNYGSLTIDASGAWTYEADNTQTAIQQLGTGDTLTDTLQVTAQDGSTQDIVITLDGVNDAAVITGTDSGSVSEDDQAATLSVTGALSIADDDAGEASFSAGTVTGSYGSLTIDASGAWTYEADNTQTAIQQLGTGDSLTDTLQVTAQDGSTQDIVITLDGVNDAAVITGTDSGSVSEDDQAATLSVTGALSIADDDAGEASFSAGTVTGSYGSLTIDASGAWTYEADNTQTAIQQLGTGDSLTDTLQVTAQDGTTQDIVITLDGVNDAAVITGTDSGSVSEDDQAATLSVTGALSIADDDAGEASFSAGTVTGSYGSLTIDASGAWTYEADNTQTAIQQLGTGDSLTDTLQVTAQDGSTQDIVITLDGVDDAAVITGTDSGSVSEDDQAATLSVTGALTIADDDAGEASFSAGTVTGSYGSLTIDASGAWTYEADNTQTAIQQLGTGDSLTDTLQVTAQDGSTQDIVITLDGVNDAAVITGTDSGSVSEDDQAATLSVTGALSIADDDAGEASFSAGTVTGSYGSLTIDASGAWTYEADNTQTAIQQLGTGDSLTDTLQVTAQDGSTQDIVITLDGVNDAAVITGTDSGSVSEDDQAATLSVTGALSIADDDAGEASFSAGTVTGSYGSLTIDASGAWTYEADNTQTAIQQLGTGDSLTDTLQVTAQDGTTQDIVITLDGANDAAVITGTDSGSVSEDDQAATLSVTGALSIADDDAGEASFSAGTVTGSYGSLTIDASGAWTYEADNTQTAIQQLGTGDSLTDTLQVTAQDGSTQDIVITLDGVNDAAVITGTDSGSVSEDDQAATLSVTGALSIADDDAGEASFSAGTVTGSYGSLTIDASGAWTYEADNTQTAIQQLGTGDSLTDTLQVTAQDGTTQDIVITLDGVNDAAVITGTDSGSVSEDDQAATLSVTGALSIADDDAGEASFSAGTVTGSYGSLTIDASGAWTYEADNTQTAIQQLGTGDSLTDTLQVTAQDGSTQDIVITLDGVNDAAVITGTDSGSVSEDDQAATLSVTGALSIADDDAGEASFSAGTVTGSYGSLTIDASGAWTYEADNTQTAIQQLGTGDSLTDTLQVTAQDGSTQDIVITLDGVNDAAVITGTDSGSVSEDDQAATLSVTGALSIADDDAGEASFSAGTVTGSYGSLTIDASGAWTYEADNTQTAIQQLGTGDSLTDTLQVTAQDGTTQDIVITLDGVNDAAVITGTDSGSVSEDDQAATLSVTGALSIADDDAGEASFSAGTVTGSYGSLTIDASGAWTYEADNTQTAIQQLGTGDSLTDTLQVTAQDGSTQDIVITLDGVNDAAVITGTDSGSVSEDDQAATLSVTGALSIADDDAGEASFSAGTVTGSYGSLTIDASGAWTYEADNTQTAIQQLGTGDSLTDTLQVTAQDGSTQDIVITLDGVNDAAVITGTDSGSVSEDDQAATLSVTGALSIADDDAGEASFSAGTVTGSYGSLTIDASGAWTYEADNTQTAIQQLGTGDSLTDTLQVTAQDGSTQDIVITLDGVNDAAVITGTDSGSVSEDDQAATLSVTGALSIADDDAGEASFSAGTVTGSYGSLTIDASGAWTYEADNTQTAIQQLGTGDSLTDTLQVTAQDGSTQDIVITLDGVNDAAVITGTDSGSVSEDDQAATLSVTGALSIADDDAGEASFSAGTVTGSYGSLTIDASGAWTYEADNTQTAIQQLGTGDSLTDTLQVTAQDGSTQDIVITLDGVNDAAVITGTDSGSVSEDDQAATLSVTGALTIADDDAGEASFSAGTVTGSYGSLTIDASGAWTYEADNTQTAIQQLGTGDSLTDTLQVTAQDGTTQDIVITLDGVNDAAVITGTDSGSVSEDDQAATLSVTGALSIADDDAGEASFSAGTVTGSYGSLTIDASGAWTYEADNTQTAIQQLGTGDSLTDTLQVTAQDGTTQDIVITLDGVNDAAVITGTDSGSVSEDDQAATLSVTGALTIADDDAGEASFSAGTVTGSYGSLTIDASGAWTYEADNTQTAIQQLGTGDSLTDTLQVTAQDGSTQDIVITLDGVNDAAVITGTDSGSVSEDDQAATLSVTGALSIADDDAGEASFSAGTVTGSYGSLTIDASGAWTYEADNTQTAIQQLGTGDSLTDTLQVTAQDGTTQDIVITLDGVNDAAVITGTDSGSVSEDDQAATLSVTGALSIADDDAGEASFSAGTVTGSYGSLTIDASGAWTYEADNTQTAIQQLGTGDSLTDTLQVTAQDGTTQDIVITLDGVNDAAVITGTDSGSVSEDDQAATLSVTGALSIADDDAGEASFSAGTVTGSYGSLTIDASGAWTYEADNTQTAIQQLGTGDSLTDTLQVTAQDGSTQDIVITLDGVNDAAVITGTDSGSVSEDDQAATLSVTGALSIADDDAGEASFSAGTVTGSYGSLTIDASGAWTYEADNTQTAIQQLGTGDSLTDTLQVTAQDGTTQDIVITLDGVNDAAVITGTDSGSVSEDDQAATLSVTGALSIADDDAGEASFSAGTVTGSYGSLTIDASGAWTYEADNTQTAIQQLGTGDSLTDTLQVTAQDGSTQDIVITLDGVNDAAVITGTDSGSVSEDDQAATLSVTGALSIADDDAGEASFSAGTVTGSYGSLTIDASGAWTYEADNTQTAIQQLGTGDSLTDTLQVTAQDGSTQDIVITLDGVNDAAVITGTDSGSVSEDDQAATLSVTGALSIADDDAGEASFSAGTVTGSYGSLTIDASGAWTYEADNTQTAIQQLGTGDSLTDTLQVTAQDGSTQDIVITLDGVNDAAVITGTDSGSVSEDDQAATLSVTGALSIADDDAGEASFSAGTVTGSYGSLTIDASGAWTYEADNTQTAIQQLGTGDSLTDTLQVTAQDGTTQDIVITLDGVNDAAVITGTDSGSVSEDDQAATLSVTGALSIADDDAGEASFSAGTVTGSYGSLTIDASGAWTYEADNTQTAIQQLGTGDSLTDTLQVTAQDGTTQDIVITLDGVNDAAVITGTDSGSVSEDDQAATLSVTGALSIADDDAGEASFSAGTVTGSYGSLTIDASGAWTYEADNTQTAIQQLGTGDSLTDTLQVTAQDGSTQDIVITLDGVNDAAVITGTDSGSVSEDDQAATLSVTGALSIADDDAGEASFSAGTVTGSYGSLTIDASGAWTYEADNTQTAIQQLGTGDSLTDTLQVTAQDGSTQDIVITLDGVNDAAVITGTNSGSVSEDDQAATLSVTGALSIADDDAGEASFSAGTVTGSYGSLTIDASGAWTYEADNTQTAIQQLGTGDTLTDTLQVTAQDGTTQDIVITLDGVNDAAVITGTDSGSVSEDDQAATLSVTGALTIADDDAGEASFSAGTVTGSYGSLTIDASGAWTYEADNTQTAIQQLGTGDTLTDTLQVTAQDGSTQDIVITLDGANDAAVITGTDSGSVSEDDQAATLSVTGALTIADDDAGEASFSAGTVTGSYGSLTIDASGAWTYEADNTQTAIQQLGTGDSLTDTLQVTAQDGSTQDIVITLDGVNDVAVITGTDSGSVSEDDQAATLSVTGALTIADDDAGEASFSAGTVTGSYGSLTIDASGAWTYEADNTQTAIQQLGTGDSLTDTLQVTAQDGSTQDIVITLDGVNDAAVITGTDSGSVSEDDQAATLSVTGALSIADDDAGEASFSAGTVTGNYGSLTIDASGAWTYEADNTQTAIQQLGTGDSLTDTLQVTAQDGSTQDIVITLDGVNDAAVITGTDSGSVSEDDQAATLSVTGALSIADDDAGEASFSAGTVTGNYGSLTIDASGAWTYEADNTQTAIQQLGTGDSLTDTLQVTAQDGTTQDIVITLDGVNDAAVITGTDSGSVSEDDQAATLSVTGALSIADDDAGEASFSAGTVTGNYGSLTIDASGAWTYEADNTQTAIQQLGTGDTLTDTLQVTAQDGTTQDIVITLDGVNDAAVITGTDSGSVSEDDQAATLSVTGALSIADDDAGEASFSAGTVTGSYGSLTIDASGAWTYEADNTQTAIQQLGTGDSLTDTLQVTAQDGTTQDIVITLDGVNDAAVITGTDSGSVSEDDQAATLSVTGALTIADDDAGEASFSAGTVTGSYGSLTIDASGAWTYEADNTQTAIQQLGTGDSLTDTLQVTAQDGTTQDIVITLDGVNDAAVITGTDSGSVSEDDQAATLSVTGALTIADDDAGEASFSAGTVTGSYGSLTIDASGAWTYEADNTQTAIQQLGTGDSLTDTLQVTAQDGSTQDIVITLDGANDAAVITGTDSGSVSEDDQAATLSVIGALSIADDDAGEASFSAGTVTGSYGSLTIDASGAWTYEADNTQTAIQQLGTGDSLTDTLQVTAQDGTTQDIVITLDGANDAAVIMGTDSGSVSEDDQAATLSVTGALTIADDDAGEASFSAGTVTGNYGSLTIDASGAWTYEADNTQTAIQQLGTGDSLTDTLQVTAQDGTTRDIVITINGTNDLTVIGGTSTGAVTEDANASTLSVTGSLTITDVDSADSDGASFTAETVTGIYGSLTIDASGSWTYSADNTQTTIQELGSGDTLTETIQVSAQDGNTQDIVITINGVNDAPELAATPLFDNISAAYNFSSTSDISNNNNNLTLHNGASLGTGRTTETGNALLLDGVNDYAEFSNFTTGGAMTISSWVKYDSFAQDWSRIFEFYNGQAEDNILMAHEGTTNTLRLHVWDGDGNRVTELEIADFFTAGEWVHVAATIGADGTYRIYKNGEVAGTWTNQAVPSEELRTHNYIGRSAWSSNGYMKGAIDDFTVFHEELSTEEVELLYLADSVDNLLDDGFHTPETSTDNAIVGSVSATDIENDTLTYSLTDDAGGRFSIDSSTGQITVADSSLLNHEINDRHTITVQVSDGSLTDTRTYTIYVTDIDEGPTVSGDTTGSVTEDSATTLTTTGSLAITDEDDGDDAPEFTSETISGSYGTLTIDESGNWTYSASNSQTSIQELGSGDTLTETIQVTAQDGTTQDIVITVNGNPDDETVYGDDGANTLYGDEGDDILYGGEGDDILFGGTGDDTLHGDAGSNTFSWSSGDAGIASDPAVDIITDFTTGSGGMSWILVTYWLERMIRVTPWMIICTLPSVMAIRLSNSPLRQMAQSLKK